MPISANFQNAGALIDEYLADLANPMKIPTQVSNRTGIEFRMEKHGIIQDVRKLRFGESHALWYACLIQTGRVREVSRREAAVGLVRRKGGSTENTIRRLLKGNMRTHISAAILQDLIKPHPALELWGKMFAEAEAEGRVENPSYWVERSVFMERCAKAGIEVPEHLPETLAWEERIGLSAFVRKTLNAYFKRTGQSRDPMTAGAHRLERQLAKLAD